MRIIDTIESASEVCCNAISGCGVLSELNIDIIDKGDSATIKYKGVIDINNAFVKFYGSVSMGLICSALLLANSLMLQVNLRYYVIMAR